MNDLRPTYPNELYHHGVKGMKWGVRRYQNEDGSLTNAGRKKYGDYLDINDRSKYNIARIRTGEAKRRYDAAKLSGNTDKIKRAQLKQRVKLAKKNEKLMLRAEKGAMDYANGKSIPGIGAQSMLVSAGATYVANAAITKAMKNPTYQRQGRAYAIAMGAIGVAALNSAVNYHKTKNMRAYNSVNWSGKGTIRANGSEEYAAVYKRKTGKEASRTRKG